MLAPFGLLLSASASAWAPGVGVGCIHAMQPPTRHAIVLAEQTENASAGDGGWFSKLAALFEDEMETAEARAAIEELCRPSGWRVRCCIGSDVARALGGSGSLAKRDTSQASGGCQYSWSQAPSLHLHMPLDARGRRRPLSPTCIFNHRWG